MQEFASVSASSSNPSALVDRLNEKSAEGWSVVAIVGGAVEVTAFLSRESSGAATISSTAATTVAAAVEPGGWASTPAAATPSAAWSDASSTAASSPVSTVSAGTSSVGTSDAASAASTQMAASSVPAQWAADPTGRYELRYWDGIRWTEHVSRAGQQYTDPL